MAYKRLTTFAIALENIKRRAFRTKCLIVITAVFAFSIFCGALLSQSVGSGANYLSDRMGADIMVVPRGHAASLRNTLIRREYNTFYFDEDLTKGISAIPGIEKVSPQIYIASLNAACCSVPVQIIGFEPETDFTIGSWLKNSISRELVFGEVVTGSLINTEVGDDVFLYGIPLKAAAILDHTGMGFDSSIFMTLETARHMIDMSDKTAIQSAGTGKGLVSALFIKLTGGTDESDAARMIMFSFPQTDTIVFNELMSDIKARISGISGLIYGIEALIFIVSMILIAAVFIYSANERKREFGVLLALGASRKKLAGLIITEALILGFSGAVLGTAAGCLIMYEFRLLIAASLGLPYLRPDAGEIFAIVAVSLIISISSALAAAFYSALKVSRPESIAIREIE